MRNTIIKVINRLLYVFNIFKIKNNRIMCVAFHGNSYTCSPKYISEYLINKYNEDFEIIWAFKEKEKFADLLPDKIKSVKYKSIKYIYYALTSKVRINNAEEWIVIPKRQGQLLINTWHGGGLYKKVGLDSKYVKEKLNGNDYYGNTDLFLASCGAAEEEMYYKSFNYKGKVLKSGLPRNDIFFTKNPSLEAKVRSKLKIDKETKIVLYAPTFREESNKEFNSLNGKNLLDALEKRFGGKWKILYRSHLGTSAGIGIDRFKEALEDYMDVSSYADMQELLYISDVLITDYSSSIWDFSFKKKPCFLYVPDLESYITEERNFYFDIYTWGFPVCKSNEDITNSIFKYDEEDYINKMEKHHKDLRSYENGNATEQVCNYIVDFCSER